MIGLRLAVAPIENTRTASPPPLGTGVPTSGSTGTPRSLSPMLRLGSKGEGPSITVQAWASSPSYMGQNVKSPSSPSPGKPILGTGMGTPPSCEIPPKGPGSVVSDGGENRIPRMTESNVSEAKPPELVVGPQLPETFAPT